MVKSALDIAAGASTAGTPTLPTRKAVTHAVTLNGLASNRLSARESIVVPALGARLKSNNRWATDIERILHTHGHCPVISSPTSRIAQPHIQIGLVGRAGEGRRVKYLISLSVGIRVVPVVSTDVKGIQDTKKMLARLHDQQQDDDNNKEDLIHYLFPIF
jgi:hypothetical protein